MIGEIKQPKTKQELIRSLQSKKNFNFKIFEINSSSDNYQITKFIKNLISESSFSVIIIK